LGDREEGSRPVECLLDGQEVHAEVVNYLRGHIQLEQGEPWVLAITRCNTWIQYHVVISTGACEIKRPIVDV